MKKITNPFILFDSTKVLFIEMHDRDVTEPQEEDSVPAHSGKMNEDTKRRVLEGHVALNHASRVDQIEAAEVQKLLHYYPTFQGRSGGFYETEYGLMKGSGGGKAGVRSSCFPHFLSIVSMITSRGSWATEGGTVVVQTATLDRDRFRSFSAICPQFIVVHKNTFISQF
jgi:hypothetical protein